MARYTQPSCRSCRRRGLKLFLKSTRCFTDKCAFERRSTPPGQHGKGRRSKVSNYGLQLTEKQKVKRVYGVLEKQFRRYFSIADKSEDVTGGKLLQLLERRLDNVIFRACFALSRANARQMVMHGNVIVNKRKVDIPSYSVKVGDIIEIKPKEKIVKGVKEIIEIVKERGSPEWLNSDHQAIRATVDRLPKRSDVAGDIQEQLIVELYSK